MQQKIDTNVSAGFSAALAVAIRDSGMSKRAFAEAVGLSHAAINNYLTGRTPKLDEAMKIARYLGVSIDGLLSGKKSVPGENAAVWRERALSAEQRLSAVKSGLSAMLKKI
jgi:transcriptional regulator with XRE-family HTH domain